MSIIFLNSLKLFISFSINSIFFSGLIILLFVILFELFILLAVFIFWDFFTLSRFELFEISFFDINFDMGRTLTLTANFQ